MIGIRDGTAFYALQLHGSLVDASKDSKYDFGHDCGFGLYMNRFNAKIVFRIVAKMLFG